MEQDANSFDEKVIAVTDGSSGIGLTAAQCFARLKELEG